MKNDQLKALNIRYQNEKNCLEAQGNPKKISY